MEEMHFVITTETGEYIHDMFIPWSEVWQIKKTFMCSVQYGQIILY